MLAALNSPASTPHATAQSLDALERELTTLAGHLNAGNYRFLKLLAEFERREGHAGWGIASCAHWLAWKCGIGLVAAREKVRVARALGALPKLSEAMRCGVLSYCKVRALTRVATRENEDYLLYIAEMGTVSHVEKTVRLYRKSERAAELHDANARRAERSLSYYFDDDGLLVINARLDPEQGALVIKALQAAGEVLRIAEDDSRESLAGVGARGEGRDDSRESSIDPDAGREPVAALRADALALMAETLLARGATALAAGDRHLVAVHVDERVLRDDADHGPSDRSDMEDGPALPPATVRRLCCDGALVALIEDADGNPLNVGRKTRAISPAIRRALDARDQGCRFPGCGNTRYVDAHHIHHWADGGETKLANLVLLCRRHHRFVHEYGFRIEHDGGLIRFVRPDGLPVPASPIALPLDRDGWLLLAEAHVQHGVRIDHQTTLPTWAGERMDYGWAVGALQRRAEVAAHPRPS
jgi:hypothetical protein